LIPESAHRELCAQRCWSDDGEVVKRVGVEGRQEPADPKEKLSSTWTDLNPDADAFSIASDNIRQQPPFGRGVFGGIETQPKTEVP